MDQGPPPAVEDRWEELLADADATAAEYRGRGWETLVVSTGDVTPLSGEPFGLDVLAPGDEFEALEGLVEAATFDTSHVYRAEAGGVRFFVVVVEAGDEEVAVVVPAFLAVERAGDLEERAREAGVMYTHVRPLSDDARVTFSHDDPDLFF
jgi:DNA-binding phage protein